MQYTITEAAKTDLPDIVEIYNSTIAARQSTADLTPVSIAEREPWFDAHGGKRPLYVLKIKTVRFWHGAASATTTRAMPITSAQKSASMSAMTLAVSAWAKSYCKMCSNAHHPWALKTYWQSSSDTTTPACTCFTSSALRNGGDCPPYAT